MKHSTIKAPAPIEMRAVFSVDQKLSAAADGESESIRPFPSTAVVVAGVPVVTEPVVMAGGTPIKVKQNPHE